MGIECDGADITDFDQAFSSVLQLNSFTGGMSDDRTMVKGVSDFNLGEFAKAQHKKGKGIEKSQEELEVQSFFDNFYGHSTGGAIKRY